MQHSTYGIVWVGCEGVPNTIWISYEHHGNGAENRCSLVLIPMILAADIVWELSIWSLVVSMFSGSYREHHLLRTHQHVLQRRTQTTAKWCNILSQAEAVGIHRTGILEAIRLCDWNIPTCSGPNWNQVAKLEPVPKFLYTFGPWALHATTSWGCMCWASNFLTCLSPWLSGCQTQINRTKER